MELHIALYLVIIITIYVITKSILNKNVKDLKVKLSFFKGFEFSCSFYKHKDSK